MPLAVMLLLQQAHGFEFDQRLAGLRARFGDLAAADWFARPEDTSHYQERLPGCSVRPISPGCLVGRDMVAMMECGRNDLSGYGADLGEPEDCRLYHVHAHGRVLPVSGKIDVGEYPFLEAHAFNKYSPRNGEVDFGCFYYFPYGYLYRFLGVGPVNEFGHRIEFDFRELEKRPANHKVVACYGGSAAYSIFCCHDQMYTKAMERRLNEFCRSNNLDFRFTVLNFGGPGHVVLNELFTHVLFGSRVRPDIVIAHDGANDVGYGSGCDPFLVNNHLIYQQQLELWACILHNPSYTGDRLAVEPTWGHEAAPLGMIVKAYGARKRQFCSIVKAEGAKFIHGLQPIFLSKPEYSDLEKRWIFDEPRIPLEQHAGFEHVRQAYKLLLGSTPSLGEDAFVDCNELFGAYGKEATLFADVVHLAPEGDRVIGEHYADRIVELMFAGTAKPARSGLIDRWWRGR
jgi:hypothetical protein